MLRQILLIIPLKRLIAYRIIIFGRINGAKKARTISLTKGKIPLQTLTKNINFGSDYSHARVGAFGVKM
jgi:ribosomal protein S3